MDDRTLPELRPSRRAVGAAAGKSVRQFSGLSQHESKDMFSARLRVNRGTVGHEKPAGFRKGSEIRRIIPRETGTRQLNPTQTARLHDAGQVRLAERNVCSSKRRVRIGASQNRFGRVSRKDKFVRHCTLLEKLQCPIAQRSIAENTQS
jgi:hypothetical protein